MNIYIEKENKNVVLRRTEPCTGSSILEELHINPATVLLVKNDEIVLLDESFSDTDDVKILSVISGG